jgi:hypothetical protein
VREVHLHRPLLPLVSAISTVSPWSTTIGGDAPVSDSMRPLTA